MFANNDDDDDDGGGDGRQLGKTVRKLENELAYLMEYHVLNGLCASVLYTDFVNQEQVRIEAAETKHCNYVP